MKRGQRHLPVAGLFAVKFLTRPLFPADNRSLSLYTAVKGKGQGSEQSIADNTFSYKRDESRAFEERQVRERNR